MDSRAPADPPWPHDRAMRASDNSPRCSRPTKGHQRQTRQAGHLERWPPGDGLLDPRNNGSFQHFWSYPLQEIFNVSPALGFHRYEMHYFREWNTTHISGICICRPRSVVRARVCEHFHFFAFFLFQMYGKFCVVKLQSIPGTIFSRSKTQTPHE